jgi:hypothetical protein
MIERRHLSLDARRMRQELLSRICGPVSNPSDVAKYLRVAMLGIDPEPMTMEAWRFWKNVRKESGVKRRAEEIVAQETIIAENYP